jgi:RNA polymerase sigma-70 factor (ECF subfamily)
MLTGRPASEAGLFTEVRASRDLGPDRRKAIQRPYRSGYHQVLPDTAGLQFLTNRHRRVITGLLGARKFRRSVDGKVVMEHELRQRIEYEIPRLRRYARALTRNETAADDLVQDTLVRGLSKLHLWQEGTDLRAWLFTILHNQHVNQVRRGVREGAAVAVSESEPSLRRAPDQDDRLALRDLDRAMALLPEEQRVVILMVGLEGMRYEAVAEIVGVPVGTVRSRLSRGREALRQLMGIREDRRAEQAMLAARSNRRLAA